MREWDDEELFTALQESLRARRAVPPVFVEAGKNAYAWRNIDAELAQLTYDSTRDQDGALAVRAESASIRALTFTSAHLTIQLEVTRDSLIGQIIPPQAGTLDVQARTGPSATIPIDDIGCFRVRPIPPGSFRLHCRTTDGTEILTRWITL